MTRSRLLITSLVFAVFISTYSFFYFIDAKKEEVNNVVQSGLINYEKYNQRIDYEAEQKRITEAKIHAEKIEAERLAKIETDKESAIVKHINKVNKSLPYKDAYDLARSVIEDSKRLHIPIKVLLAIITVESHFDKNAVGSSGEISYFQVMPTIHEDKIEQLRRENIITSVNLHNTRTNTAVGAQILKSCFNRYTQFDMKLACYNGSQDDENKTYPRKVMRQISLTKL